MRVVIVGGGVTGLFSAYYLLKDGHQVTIVDDNPETVPTSVFNAGLIVPSAGALPGMGMRTILAPYFGRSGPIYISVSEVVRNLFWFRIGLRKGLSGYETALTALGEESLRLYSEFFGDVHLEVDLHPGVASLYRDKEHAKRAASLAKARYIDEDEISRMGFRGLGGGAYSETECSVNPFKLYNALRVTVKDLGAELLLGNKAQVVAKAGRVTSVAAGSSSVPADRYLITAGSWSRELVRSLGYDVPVLPARGLAMLFETGGKEIVSTPALLEDDGIGVSQHNADTLRLTSFFEMVGFNDRFAERRKEWVTVRARRYVTRFDEARLATTGVGFRPCTPDQVPIIGAIPGVDNAFVATGNCRLGVTLAPGTASMVRYLIEGRTEGEARGAGSRASWAFFDPARFS